MSLANLAAYDRWWTAVEPSTRERAAISLGHPAAGVVTLNSPEWRENALSSVTGLREGVKRRGIWDVDVVRDGTYEIAFAAGPKNRDLRSRPLLPHGYRVIPDTGSSGIPGRRGTADRRSRSSDWQRFRRNASYRIGFRRGLSPATQSRPD